MERFASLPAAAPVHALMARPAPEDDFSALIEALRDPRCYPHPVVAVEKIETHISVVLLAGDFAYKLKKPVKLPFLDFTAREARRAYCAEELRINRRTAPGLYLDVVPIAGPAWAPRAGGAGPALEHAVRMRRFPQEALASRLAARGAFDAALAEALAASVASFHLEAARLPVGDALGSVGSVAAPALDNFREIAALGLRDAGGALERLRRWTLAGLAALAPRFEERRGEGFVRECHGDLHLGNVVLLDGAPVLFDAIEFSPGLRWTDVMADVAFVSMDLASRGCERAAASFVNRYVELTGDHRGLDTLRFYEVYRALVRAKVAGIRQGQPGLAAGQRRAFEAEFERYVRLAERLSHRAAPAVVLMHGLAGSGKTMASSRLVEAMGAIRLRSDVERKRLHGLAESARCHSSPGSGIYADRGNAATYGHLLLLARKVLDAGRPVVVDAAFLRRADRDAFRRLAAAAGAAFGIVSCVAPEATLRARVAERERTGLDPSEAGIAVLEGQMAAAEPIGEDERAHATRVQTDLGAEARCALESLARRLKGEHA